MLGREQDCIGTFSHIAITNVRTSVSSQITATTKWIISAILLFMNKPLGEKLTLVCGGMMLFLTVIDIAYFAQHDLFAKERGGAGNWGLVIPMVVMSVLMIFRFL